MKILFFIVLTGLSELSFARYGLRPIPKDSCDFRPSQKIEVENMPSVDNIKNIGVCYASTTGLLINKEICRSMNFSPCDKLPLDQKVSFFDLSRYQLAEAIDNRTMREEFEGLDLKNGGNTKWVLANSIGKGRRDGFLKESCQPFEHILTILNDPSAELAIENKRLLTIQKIYDVVKSKSTNDKKSALDYLTTPSKDFNDDEGKPISPKQLLLNYGIEIYDDNYLLEAFLKNTYEITLDYLLIPDRCWDIKETVYLPPKLSVNGFPALKEHRNYESFIGVIKRKMKQQVPLAVSFCMQEPFISNRREDCNSAHVVAVIGYCRSCDKNGKNCVDALKIQNSWGIEWQKKNSDGWIYAKELLDRTSYMDDTLVWIDNENAKTE